MKKAISLAIVLIYAISILCSTNVVFANHYEEQYYLGNNNYLYYEDGTLILSKKVISYDIDEEQSLISVLVEEDNDYIRYESDLTDIDFKLVCERNSVETDDEDEILLFGTSERESEIYKFLINDMKLNQAGAAGVIANLFCEDGNFDPNKRQGGGSGFGSYNDATGYGICQWTYWSRKKNLQEWCNKNLGKGSWSTLNGQLKFMKHELEKSYTTALKKIKSVPNTEDGAYDAGYYFCYNYERPEYYKKPYKKGGKTYKSESDYRGQLSSDKYWKKYGKIAKPAQPTIKNAVPQSSKSIKVTWNAVNGATSYKVGIRKSSDENYKDTTVTGTSYIYNNLKPNTTYYFRLYAVNSAGTSKRSVTFKTGTLTNTPQITEIATGPVHDSQLVISWKAVAGADCYKIERYRGDEGVDKVTVISKKATGTSYTDKNLKPNSKYWYRIYAVKNFSDYGNEDSRGAKAFTSAVSETVGKFTRISTPTITKNDSTPNKVTFTWTKAYGGNSYQYKVWRQSSADKELKTIKTTTNLNYTDTSLKPGNVYKYKIETVTVKDNHCTNTYDFYVAPKITKAPVVTPQSGTEMNVSWDKVSSPVKIKYALVRKVNGKETTVATTTNNSCIDTGLTANTAYSYYVKVLDNSGNELTTTSTGSAVLQILPTNISVNKTSLTMTVGETEQLTENITPGNTTNANVIWASENSSIATVSSTGLVTAKTAGTTTISATTANGKTAISSITVVEDVCTFGDWITDKDPTCAEEGHQYRVCEKHGEKEETVIEARGHSYSDEMLETKKATCADDGEKAYVCSVCGDKKDITLIEKLDHSFGEWITEKKANCNESGLEYRECSLCGFKETKDIETTTHSYVLTGETETTPDGPGSRTYTCSICQDKYTEVYVLEVAEGEIRMGSASPRPGESVTIPVTISENPGITGFELSLEYDKKALIPTEINGGELLTSGLFMSTLDSGVSAEELDTIKVVWSNDTAINTNGELFNITFEVKKDAKEGNHSIGLNYEKGWITDENFYDVMPSVIDNSITVADVLMGDVNQDRRVDSMDHILLTKRIAEIPGIVFNENQKKAANVHHDYKNDGSPNINIKDGTRLAQLLAGYQFGEVETLNLMSAENIDIAVGSTEAFPGEYISIPVKISNNTGISGFRFALDYDSKYLTPIAVSNNEILNDGLFTSNFDEETNLSELDKPVIYWSSADSMTSDGTLFTIDFLVSENAVPGQEVAVGLTYDKDDICNYMLQSIEADITNGKVKTVALSEETEETAYHYYINDAYVEIGGLEENAFPVNGNFDLTVCVQGEYDETLTPNMFVACYSENGNMLSVKEAELTENVLSDGKIIVNIPESKTDISKIKIFVWNSSALIPLATSYELFSK